MDKKSKTGIIIVIIGVIFASVLFFETEVDPPIETVDTVPLEIIEERPDFILWEDEKITLDSFTVVSFAPDDPNVAILSTGFHQPMWDTPIINTDPCEYVIADYTTKAHYSPKISSIDLEKAERIGIPKVLIHEQGHFDITEIYAGIINQTMKVLFVEEIPCPNVDNVTEFIIRVDAASKIVPMENKIEKIYNATQDSYEKETNYGNDDVEQERWTKKINACLSLDLMRIEICLELNKITVEHILER